MDLNDFLFPPTCFGGHRQGIHAPTYLKQNKIYIFKLIRPIPETVVTVFSTPDDGCCDNRNM